MTSPKEIEMDTNQKASDNSSEWIVELGAASVETQGSGMTTNELIGHQQAVGISE